MAFSVYLLIGVFTGTLSGLLGIGGGIIVVPALLVWFQHTHLFPNEITMHVATGTSLATMIGTSISSATAYHQRGFVVWPIFLRFFPGLCVGMILGSSIANQISSHLLVNAFAIFLLLIAAHLIFSKHAANVGSTIWGVKQRSRKHSKIFTLFNSTLHAKWMNTVFVVCVVMSIFIGALSTLFGIGGGLLIVPFFLFLGLSMNTAAGTSAFCGIPIAIIGTIILTISGWQYTQIQVVPGGTVGYVYWPGALVISLSSMLFARFGAHYAIKTRPMIRELILSAILILCSFNMLFYR